MNEIIKNLVWSVNSFNDKQNTKAEMGRVLYNKKHRANTEQQYIDNLITNIGYYTILISGTFQMMEHCLNNKKVPTLDWVSYLIDDIKSKCNDDTYYNEVANNYLGSNAKNNHGMGFIEKLEFDYVYCSYMVNLTQAFIEYLDNEVNKHISLKLITYNPESIVGAIDNEISKHTRDFMDFYNPPKRIFAS